MDLNSASGLVAIHKTTFLSRPIQRSKPFWNHADYWLYNSTNVLKYRTEATTYIDGNGVEQHVDETSAMNRGILNLLQVGELPSVAGVIQPIKYWEVVNGKPKLKGPDDRQAADEAEVAAAEDAQAKRDEKEALKPKRSHVNRVMNKVMALDPATATMAEVVDVFQDLSPLLYGALATIGTPIVEDEG